MESASVRAERARLDSEYEAGFWEGYEASPQTLPAFWFTKAPGHMTARQRGYFFGREVRRTESAEASSNQEVRQWTLS